MAVNDQQYRGIAEPVGLTREGDLHLLLTRANYGTYPAIVGSFPERFHLLCFQGRVNVIRTPSFEGL